MPGWAGRISGCESQSGSWLGVGVQPGDCDQTHVAQREAAIAPLGRLGVLQMLNFANDHMRAVDCKRMVFP